MPKTRSNPTVTLRCRVSQADVHYAGGIASGAKVLELFGDAATCLLIKLDGDEGLFRAYESIDFLAPVHAGDFLEVAATLIKKGNSSRKIEFQCFKIIQNDHKPQKPSRASVLKKPLLVAQATGTCIVK